MESVNYYVIYVDKYQNSRKRLTNAIERKNRPELESALGDFEASLYNEELKENEKSFVETAVEEKEYLIGIEGISLNWKISKFSISI